VRLGREEVSPFLKLLICLLLLAALNSYSADSPLSREASPNDAFLSDLKKARKLRTKLDEIDLSPVASDEAKRVAVEFHDLLRKHAKRFPLLAPGRGPDNFTLVRLNGYGAELDAVRVRNRSDEPMNFVWSYVVPRGHSMANFYIISQKPQENFRGFTTFRRVPDSFKDAPWLGSNTSHIATIQSLTNLSLRPHEEYIIWFAFKSSQPVSTYIAHNFVPEDTPLESTPDMMDALGLRWR
jgi:hypothetical protein